jgi:hypothetical protein
MSEYVLFDIGAVIFAVVSTSVLLYGFALFRNWDDDPDRAELIPSTITTGTTPEVVAAFSSERHEDAVVAMSADPV